MLRVEKVIEYRGECYFGDYPTGFKNWETDWLALYLIGAIDRMYRSFLDGYLELFPQWSYELVVRDMKEDFQNCDFGHYCTGLNIEVNIKQIKKQ